MAIRKRNTRISVYLSPKDLPAFGEDHVVVRCDIDFHRDYDGEIIVDKIYEHDIRVQDTDRFLDVPTGRDLVLLNEIIEQKFTEFPGAYTLRDVYFLNDE